MSQRLRTWQVFFQTDKFSKIVFPMKLREDMFSNQNEDPERGEGLRTREGGPQGEVKGCSRPCMVCTQLFCFTSCHFLLFFPPPPCCSSCGDLPWSSLCLKSTSLLPNLPPSHPSGKHQNLRGTISSLSQSKSSFSVSIATSSSTLFSDNCSALLHVWSFGEYWSLPMGCKHLAGRNHVWTSSISFPLSSAWPQVVAWWWIDEWGKGPCASSEVGSKVEDVFDCW